MYDDGWVYSKPGKFRASPATAGKKPPADAPAAETPGNPAANVQVHSHHHKHNRDTFDSDPDTASMYDDGWVYSKPGKFRGGPASAGKKPPVDAPAAETPANPAANVQVRSHRSRKDTYDKDPTSASMYDDGRTYTDKPGSLKWKYEAASPATPETPVAAAEPAPAAPALL